MRNNVSGTSRLAPRISEFKNLQVTDLDILKLNIRIARKKLKPCWNGLKSTIFHLGMNLRGPSVPHLSACYTIRLSTTGFNLNIKYSPSEKDSARSGDTLH